MPVITPNQKINQTKMFGDDKIEIKLVGDNYDECAAAAKEFTKANNMTFVPPFDDYRIIEGQATVGVEILEESHLGVLIIYFFLLAVVVLLPVLALILKRIHPKQKLLV